MHNKFKHILRSISIEGGRFMRQNIILECVETGERLYLTSKNKRNNPERLELKKYSPKLPQTGNFQRSEIAKW